MQADFRPGLRRERCISVEEPTPLSQRSKHKFPVQTGHGGHKLYNPSHLSCWALFLLSPLILQGEQGPRPASSFSGVFLNSQRISSASALTSQLSPPKATFLAKDSHMFPLPTIFTEKVLLFSCSQPYICTWMNNLQETAEDRGVWRATVHGVTTQQPKNNNNLKINKPSSSAFSFFF